MHVVILNGPPECGKDELANLICTMLNPSPPEAGDMWAPEPKVYHVKSSQHVQDYMVRMFGFTPEEFELKKSTPDGRLGHITPRDFVIHYIENHLVPVFGKTAMAYLTYKDIVRQNIMAKGNLILITGCGKQEEVDYWRDNMSNPVGLIQIERKGKSFAGDSRSYLEGDWTIRVENKENLQRDCARTIIDRIFTAV